MKRNFERELDRLLDQYLAGKLTEEQMKIRHNELVYLQEQQERKQYNTSYEYTDDIGTNNNGKTYSVKQLIKKAKLTKGFFNKKYALIVTAAVFVFVSLGFAYIYTNSDSTYRLFNKYSHTYSINSTPRAFTNGHIQDNWDIAKFKYEMGNYEGAAKNLHITLKAQSDDQYLDYMYIGICQLKKGAARDATIYLAKGLEKQPPPEIKDALNWYQALAYLKLQDFDKCKSLLKRISSSAKSQFSRRASSLLQELG